ncbi:ZYRO0D01958p [Zygosaccharomyces rouxii]|uniref:ZYRO0D01958p n=1 Tax=Zygosaccharomyces rouxii (strain ATCC 2623 / CBS 732 / NBRC 1130 / NCYC 568 / NRRL Y-229) TaxID=559307 RepID=C5DUW6_ZYGRC|nr:uncharacterized protein ZYRO0D01958g [Zygosaccharomyces rouxii]KAH9200501.1 Sodium/calcium exchanger protein-domain-containing protein [Zygosaccharomyces rouxii]CAR27585.1 ZYRO0D01958p [Zygosaccharomyces rouxii]
MDWVLAVAHPKLLYGDATVSWTFLVPSFLHMATSFVLLGVCASDYLCPNVARLADSNGHGTGTLMAVLLSWCNSSPDLFSNFMSWVTPTNHGSNGGSSMAASLSIGEVLGACGIILCVVIGSIFTIMASVSVELTKAQRHSFVRDLGFAFVAIGILCYVCLRNRITVLNCCLMVMVYLVYLIFKFKYRVLENALSTDALELDTNHSSEQALIDENTLRSHIKPSIISAMDFNSLLTMLENSKTGSKGRTELEDLANPQGDSRLFVPQRPNTEPTRRGSHSDELADVSNMLAVPQSSPAAFGPYHDDPEIAIQEELAIQEPAATSRPPRKGQFKRLKSGLFRLFLPHLVDLNKKTVVDAILSLLTAPFVILLRLSCPQPFEIAEFDDYSGKYVISTMDITLLFIQSVICPHICLIILSCIMDHKLSIIYWILAMICSVGLTTLMLQFYKSLLSHNRFSLLRPTLWEQESASESRRVVEKSGTVIAILFTTVGIINSILWISLIANSVIEMMELYQRITHISQAILGLTIFAWGNSISDIISNIAMCRLYRKLPQGESSDSDKVATKFFMISCTSCLGGVMLNSMGGIGISGLVALVFILDGNGKWWFERSVELHSNGAIDYKFIVSCIALVLQILLLALIFGSPSSTHQWFKERMKPLGITMCCIWGVATLCNILLESF